MVVVCNSMRMGRWSELIVVCVCHSDEVMRETDANDTSGELGSALPGSLVGESVFRFTPPSWLRSPLGLVACKAYVFQWGYDGRQPSIVSLGTTSRLSGNQLEDDGSSVCVLYLAYVRSNQTS